MFDWSGKNADTSGKGQGILISCVSGNPAMSYPRSPNLCPEAVVDCVGLVHLRYSFNVHA